jgi:NADH dehydrogenase (ubiquinone) 1 beta subcomplex subunit 8
MWGPDTPPVPPQTALRHFSYVVLSFITLGVFAKYYLVPEIPVVRREYPFGGLSKELGGLDDNHVCHGYRRVPSSMS